MKISKGTTRVTILIGKLAFKIPILNRSVKHFVKGWLGNLDEREIWRTTKESQLCPILFSFMGLINVMKRAQPAVGPFDKQKILHEFDRIIDLDIHVDVCSGWKNFGYIGTKLVLLDYATCRESNDQCSDCDENCILKN